MRILFALLAFVCVNSLNAQNWHSPEYVYDERYEGYVITKEGEKIQGYVKYRNRFIMQEEVIFFTDKDNEKTKKRYFTHELQGFGVADKVYECLAYSGGASVTEIRALLVVRSAGCIKEYVWYDRADGYTTMVLMEGETEEQLGTRKFPPTKIYYKTGDDIPVSAKYFEDEFEKKMALYIKENKELVKKVKSGLVGYNKAMYVDAIFKEYNEGCK